MGKQKTTTKSIDSGLVNLILLGAAVTTLYFNTKIQDPFNSPKLWIISLVAAWLVGHLVVKRNALFAQPNRTTTLVLLIFLASGFLSLLNTHSFYIGFFGENQRRNGYLSYLSLAIILLISSMVFRFSSVTKIYTLALIVGAFLSSYGLLQSSGLDFIKWNNPYNSVISTVGNPNFAASIIAIIATLNFGAAMQSTRNKLMRGIHGSVVLLSLFVIIQSGALQGLIALAIGVGTITLTFLFTKSKNIGYLGSALTGILGLIAILGMLQVGPLTQYLYKSSVSIRGYYWRAGIKMLTENPIFGVGLDSYGSYFKQVREVSYPLNYGFDITSNNAHNVPIQLFSTGGFLFGLAYLCLVLLILKRGFQGIRKYEGNQRLVIATFFGAWLAYQAQTIISIDNIGISVWGWLLGGVVLALSGDNANTDLKIPNRNQLQLMQPMISGFMVLIMLVPIVGLYQSESLMYKTRAYFNPQDANSKGFLLEYANKTISTTLAEPTYKITSANYLFAAGFQNEGINVLKEYIDKNERDLDAITSLVQIYEQIKDFKNAMYGREKIKELDPWNTKNLLQLGREYKYFNELDKMRSIMDYINSFDQVSEESKLARAELIG
jgi:O-antigen ligase